MHDKQVEYELHDEHPVSQLEAWLDPKRQEYPLSVYPVLQESQEVEKTEQVLQVLLQALHVPEDKY